ncbi:hypothetical protein ACLKA7_002850 [Drosophila subpalustris]
MSSYGSSASSTTWCLCEKLPRSILHIAPPSTPELWCEVCGRRRRPRACFSSSSDEEELAARKRQLMLAEQLRKEEEEVARQDLVRVKKPKPMPQPRPGPKINCFKCGQQKQPMNVEQVKLRNNNNNRLYVGRFGHYRKPQRVHAKRRDEHHEVESKEQLDIEPHPTVAPPPPSPPPSPPRSGCGGESVWEQPNKDMPNLVAFAHEVFNRPLHLRKRQSNFYDNLFVSDFIPLDKPITDASGGAISKRRRLNGRPLRAHYSRPLPPLSQVLSQILAKQKVRAKGGGLPAKEEANNAASQFSPFDSYEGPSEDALVVESARQMLRQPKALHIKERADLPTTRLSSFDSDPSSDCSSSSPFDMPTAAPPAQHPRNNYSVGAPLRLHEMMKAVAQSGLSDSSASSSSTGSSSHKSASSTLPVLQQSVRSRGGEEPPYEEKPVEPADAVEPLTIMEKILWLMEQKPSVDVVNPIEHKLESNQVNQDNQHTESVKDLMQFMERLQIKVDDNGWASSTLQNDTQDELKTTVDTSQLSNELSNELPLKSDSNKSAGDAKYVNGLSKDGKRSHLVTDNRGTTTSAPNSTTSMWSIISGFFTSKRSNGTSASSSSLEETKPLKNSENLKYGSINQHRSKEELLGCRDDKKIQVITEDEIESPTMSQDISNVNDIAGSTASSAILESRPIQTDIHLKELLEKLRKRQPKLPTIFQMVKTIETIRYECGEIIQPKMVSSARETGRLKKYILKPISLSKPFGLLEFRTPDKMCETPQNPVGKLELRYRNPAAALLSACASVSFWLIYWLAQCLIFLAGLSIVFGLLFPRHAWFLLNHLLNQYHVERQFKDEL